MMMQEFENLTGFYPTTEHYAAIEEAYLAFGSDKVAFCKAYKRNTDGMADSIARKVSLNRIVADDKAARETAKRISDLEAEVERLRAALDRELEWKPYECQHNVSQASYEALAESVKGGAAHYMDDSEAVNLIAREFGFNPAWVKIIHEVDAEEVNRHGAIRRTGAKLDRRPCYCATDYYYVRFDVRGRSYEAWNDDLRQFWS